MAECSGTWLTCWNAVLVTLASSQLSQTIQTHSQSPVVFYRAGFKRKRHAASEPQKRQNEQIRELWSVLWN